MRSPDSQEGAPEAWQRLTDEPEVRGVEAASYDILEDPAWQVTVWVAEFLREDPFETELRRGMMAALRMVDGVAAVHEDDREVWLVTGTPSGHALVHASAQVVDALADRARAHIESLG